MTVTLTPQSARIPLAWVQMPDGTRLPALIANEWFRYVTVDIFNRIGGNDAPTNTDLGSAVSETQADPALSDLSGAEALRGVDELRNALASTRGDLQDALRRVDELASRLEGLPTPDALIKRVELIEDRLA